MQRNGVEGADAAAKALVVANLPGDKERTGGGGGGGRQIGERLGNDRSLFRLF